MRTLILNFLIVFLTIPMTLQGQSKHFWEGSFSPTLSHRLLDDDNGVDQKMGLRYDMGIRYGYAVTSNLNLFIGVGYSRMGYNFSGYYPRVSDNIDILTYRDFLEFPMLVKYKFKEANSNSFFVDAGFTNQIFIYEAIRIKQKDYQDLEHSDTYKDLKRNYKTYNLALLIGFSYQRELNEHIYLTVNPFFKYGMFSLNNIHDLSIGLRVGMGLKF